jgi:uncharacterized protein YjbJ (UPF0337 family)
MGTFENKADTIKGDVKETIGSVTDDHDLEAEGKRDQAGGKLRDAADDSKDAVKRVFD